MPFSISVERHTTLFSRDEHSISDTNINNYKTLKSKYEENLYFRNTRA